MQQIENRLKDVALSNTDGPTAPKQSKLSRETKKRKGDDSELPDNKKSAVNLCLDEITYQGRGLKDNLHGDVFQQLVLMMVLWRAKHADYSDFGLATEFPDAEKFDDVVLIYRRNKNSNPKCRLFQVKHCEKSSSSSPPTATITIAELLGGKDYNLEKYLQSFIKIQKKCLTIESSCSEFFGKTVEDVTIVTTKKFNKDALCLFEEDEDQSLDRDELLQAKKFEDAKKYKIRDGECGARLKKLLDPTYKFIQNLAKYLNSKSEVQDVEMIEHFNGMFELVDGKTIKLSSTFLNSPQDIMDKLIKELAFQRLVGKSSNFDKLITNLKVDADEHTRHSFEKPMKPNLSLKDKKKCIECIICRPYLIGQIVQSDTISEAKDILKMATLPVSKTVAEKLQNADSQSKKDFIDEFLRKFRVITGYPNRIALYDILKTEMEVKYCTLDDEAKIALYYRHLSEWMTARQSSFYTYRKAEDLFMAIENSVLDYEMLGVTESFLAKTLQGYEFKSGTLCQDITEFLQNKQIQVIALTFDDPALGRIRFTQAFKQLQQQRTEDSLQNYVTKFGYVFISMEELQNENFYGRFQRQIEKGYEKKWNFVVIDCTVLEDTKTSKNFSDSLKIILENLLKSSGKLRKILLIGSSCKSENYSPAATRKYNTTICDLPKESIIKLFGNGNVLFQQNTLLIKDVFDQTSAQLIHSKILKDFIMGNTVEIGAKTSYRLGYDPSCYVQRYLMAIHIDWNIQKKVKMISSKSFAMGDTDLIVVSDTEDDFQKAVKESTTYSSIHWLQNTSANFIWRKSRGSLSKLLQYRKRSTTIVAIPESELLNNEGVTIISDGPGMGKSVVLNSLVKMLKEVDPLTWIIRIDLNDFTSQFAEELNRRNKGKPEKHAVTDPMNDVKSTILFLFEMLQLNEKAIQDHQTILERGLLNDCFERMLSKTDASCKLKLVILFDGFDEISPDYDALVLDLILALKKANVQRIFITTRPSPQDALDIRLESFTFTFCEFSKEDKIKFLNHYWMRAFHSGNSCENINLERVEKFAASIINKYSALSTGTHTDFTGIPLHLRMLAEILSEECYQFSISAHETVDHANGNYSLYDLYEKFIQIKYNIYREEKTGQKMSNVASNNDAKKLLKLLTENHQKLAANVLFSKQRFHKLLSIFGDPQEELQKFEEFIEEMQNGYNMYGFVICKRNNSPRFIHRTFVEYFFATVLGKVLLKGNQPSSFYFFIKEKILYNRNYNIVRSFLDAWLIKNIKALPTSVYEKFNRVFRTEANRPPIEIREFLTRFCGEKGIVALRLLSETHESNSTSLPLEVDPELLVENYIDINWRDQDQNTTLHDAIKCGRLNACKLYIKTLDQETRQAFVNVVNVKDESALHLAALQGDLDCANFLVDCNADLGLVNSNHETVVHCAVKGENIEVCKLLLERADTYTKNRSNKSCQTVLHYAVIRKNPELVQLLLDSDVSPLDNTTSSCLHYACKYTDLQITQMIVEHVACDAAFLNYKDGEGQTALHVAVDVINRYYQKSLMRPVSDSYTAENISHLSDSAILEENLEIIKFLVEKGADVEILDNTGNSVLFHAAYCENLDVFSILLESIDEQNKESIVNLRNSNGFTVFNTIVAKGNYKFARYLLENGARITYENPPTSNLSDLRSATYSGHLDILKLIIETVEIEKRDYVINCGSIDASLLQIAALLGHHHIVQYLLDMNARIVPPNMTYHLPAIKKRYTIRFSDNQYLKLNTGCSVLHAAALSGDIDTLTILVESLEPSMKNYLLEEGENKQQTVLHIAAQAGNPEMVEYLLNAGANINRKDIDGNTALHHAAMSDNVDAAKLLVDSMESLDRRQHFINLPNSKGHCALHCAAINGNCEMATFLLSLGSNTIQQDETESMSVVSVIIKDTMVMDVTPSTSHSTATLTNSELIRQILEDQIAIEAPQDCEENSILHNTVLNESSDMLRLLLGKAAAYKIGLLAQRNINGQDALHLALEINSVEKVEILLEHGAVVDQQDYNGNTAVHIAVSNGSSEALHLLVAYTPPDEIENILNRLNNSGLSVLHIASLDRHQQIVKYLLANGAHITQQDIYGNLAFHHAALGGDIDTFKLLVEFIDTDSRYDFLASRNSIGQNVWHISAFHRKHAIINYLHELDFGRSIGATDSEGNTFFHYAAMSGNVEIFRDLTGYVERSDLIEIFNKVNDNGCTPLQIAVRSSHTELVQYLLEYDSRIAHQDRNGNTALHYASYGGNVNILWLLINSLDSLGMLRIINFRNRVGQTPLHAAVRSGKCELVECLLRSSADKSQKDCDGNTATRAALKQGFFDMFMLLQYHGIQQQS